jgi:hypothetical protein
MKRKLPRVEEDTSAPRNGSHESITEEERATLVALKGEVDSMKRRQALLQREHTLLSADIIRKEEELEKKGVKLTKKYGIEKGVREVELKTGRIITYSKRK